MPLLYQLGLISASGVEFIRYMSNVKLALANVAIADNIDIWLIY